MTASIWLRNATACVAMTAVLFAQAPPPGFPRPVPLPPPAQPAPQQPRQPQQLGQPQQPGQTQTPAAQTPAAQANPAPARAPGPPTVYGGLSLNNASLTEVIDLLARQLKINYILDPRVKGGGVILNTYGETKDIDTRSLLETILRINGYAMVKQGDIYRIVPMAEATHQAIPLERIANSNDIPDDDRIMLNLVFLKYVTADELAKVLEPFLGENARAVTYAAANMIFLLDSRRNMRRLMELISLFDSDTLVNQRVHLFEVTHSQPSDLAKELDTVVKSISLNEKNAPIKFIPINRINTIVAIAPNPGAFIEVEKWVQKLDVPAKITAGAVDNYVYRVKFQQAQLVAAAIMALYYGGNIGLGGYGGFGGGFGGGGFGGGGFGGGFGGLGAGGGIGTAGFGGGGYGGGFGGGGYGGYGGGGGYGGYGGGGYGGAGYGAGAYGAGGYGAGGYGAGGFTTPTSGGIATPNSVAPTTAAGTPGATAAGSDLTGQYLGVAPGAPGGPGPRIIPNPLDNTLLIQATPQQYEGILKLLKQLDKPPRQVLIEAKIYEVDLNNQFSSGVSAYLQNKNVTNTPSVSTFKVLGSLVGDTTSLSAGALVGKTRQLLAFVQLQEDQQKAKTISAPSIIATDSIPAIINVGDQIPTLSSQAVTGVQVNGSSAFANTISNVQTGVTLNILARVNPSGIVTMIINQNVSAPIPAPAGSANINSPSFSQRTVSTQVTVNDGDTIAIGGIINEDSTLSTSGIPILEKLPYVGGLFGSHSISKKRTELIVFMTPRVIYDTNEMDDASDELRTRLKQLRKIVKE